MPRKLISSSAYNKLLADIRREMARGIRKVEELLERQKVLSYWVIGQKINTYFNKEELPRGGVGQFYQDLSRDLDIHDRTLQQCEQFYRYFPKLKTDKDLKWSHYRFLLVVPDAKERQRWIARIKKENLSADALRLALLPADAPEQSVDGPLPAPTRGRLFLYRLLRADDIENFETPWFVDVGFASRREAPTSDGVLNNKYLYASEKTPEGYRLKVVDAKVDELFTFRAKLRRVIDGDTLLVMIDQGFSLWTEQRLRLKGIDAPELATLDGQRAKKWLETELHDSPDLVVKTYKSDKWDRYLVDVYYLPKVTDLTRIATQGTWLNGRLVEEGVAKIWKA